MQTVLQNDETDCASTEEAINDSRISSSDTDYEECETNDVLNENENTTNGKESSELSKNENGSFWSNVEDLFSDMFSAVIDFITDIKSDFEASGGTDENGIGLPISKNASIIITTPEGTLSKVANYNNSDELLLTPCDLRNDSSDISVPSDIIIEIKLKP